MSSLLLPQRLLQLYPQAFACPMPGSPGRWYVADRPHGSLVGMGDGEAAAIADAEQAMRALGIRGAKESAWEF